MRNPNIKIILDNGGGITIQNESTLLASYFASVGEARHDLNGVLTGDDMSGWEASAQDYLTPEMIEEHAGIGGYRVLDDEDVIDLLVSTK